MDYIFFDLFNFLNNQKEIETYKALIEIENKIEEIVKNKINDFINEKEKYDKLIKPKNNNSYLPINLLNEIYDEHNDNYPMNNYFYYCDYITEDYLLEQLSKKAYREYPVTIEYLKNRNNDDILFLRNLHIFNEVLNMFREKYSYFKTRKDAEKTSLKDDELYKKNKEKIEKFISFYNSIKKEIKGEYTLSENNKISDFFIDDNDKNPIGKSYINIYNKFIKIQNEKLLPLLEIKTEKDIFDENCKIKINIQNSKEDEILFLNLSSEQSPLDIIFNNSFRKYAINNEKDSINQYEKNYEQIERDMTDLLLKDKKLFKEDIIKFIYKNEDLNFENIDIITKFNEIYSDEKELLLEDKFILYDFYKDNKDFNIIKNTINDFKTLIIYLIKYDKKNNEEENRFNDGTKILNICEILNKEISENFKKIFTNRDININKLSNLLEFFLILVYPTIKEEIFNYSIEIPEKKIENINNYFNQNHLINKEDLAFTLRMFISSFLPEEKNKEERIKKNENNFINYLDNIPDIWKKSNYNNKIVFKEEINNIKNLDIQLNQASKLYDIIGKKFEEDYFSDLNKELKKREEDKKKEQQEKENINAQNIDNKKEDNENKNDNEEEEEEEEDIYKNNDANNIGFEDDT